MADSSPDDELPDFGQTSASGFLYKSLSKKSLPLTDRSSDRLTSHRTPPGGPTPLLTPGDASTGPGSPVFGSRRGSPHSPGGRSHHPSGGATSSPPPPQQPRPSTAPQNVLHTSAVPPSPEAGTRRGSGVAQPFAWRTPKRRPQSAGPLQRGRSPISIAGTMRGYVVSGIHNRLLSGCWERGTTRGRGGGGGSVEGG